MNDIIRSVKKEIVRLGSVKEKIDNFIAKAPKGSLKFQVRNGHTYYYHQQVNNKLKEINDKQSVQNEYSKKENSENEHGKVYHNTKEYITREYIKKSDISLAKELAQKQYYMSIQPIVDANLKELNHFIKSYKQEELEDAYDKLPKSRKQLIVPVQLSIKEKHKQWLEETYEKNNSYPENLRYETEQGELVRSKSEVIIANLLYKYRKDILYKYERPLEIMVNGIIKTVYPDFTIFNLHTGEIKYWEHAGRMDDAYYANEFVKKMNVYIANGLIPGRDVLLTFESQSNPLDISNVKQVLKQTFLS